MTTLIFWIIICSWLIPFGIRMYKRSQQRRINNNGHPDGRFQQGGYPGNLPEHISGQYPPAQYPPTQYPPQSQYPAQSQYPPSQYPSAGQPPAQYPVPPSQSGPPSSSIPVPAASEPEGFRARKLAELDRQFSDGKIAMEEYMKLRQEIMNG